MNAITKEHAAAHAAAFVAGNPAPYQSRRVKPSYKTIIETLHQWADDCKDDDEMTHMSYTFDDIAAQMANAHEWANEAREQAAVEGPDNSWTARQDAREGEMT